MKMDETDGILVSLPPFLLVLSLSQQYEIVGMLSWVLIGSL
jgi:hypothetical protein